jgi:serine/threonine protein kinase
MLHYHVFLILYREYAAGGELVEYLASKNRFTEEEARKFFRQLISAIDHIHRANIVHRDLKLENILLSKNMDILVTDFGLGRIFVENDDSLSMVLFI